MRSLSLCERVFASCQSLLSVDCARVRVRRARTPRPWPRASCVPRPVRRPYIMRFAQRVRLFALCSCESRMCVHSPSCALMSPVRFRCPCSVMRVRSTHRSCSLVAARLYPLRVQLCSSWPRARPLHIYYAPLSVVVLCRPLSSVPARARVSACACPRRCLACAACLAPAVCLAPVMRLCAVVMLCIRCMCVHSPTHSCTECRPVVPSVACTFWSVRSTHHRKKPRTAVVALCSVARAPPARATPTHKSTCDACMRTACTCT